MEKGFLVLENGLVFQGHWLVGKPSVGEIVFNTSHNGYEEISTDPSYFGQIMVMSAPQQGNYGVDKMFWESRQLWIQGFIALEIQKSKDNSAWLERLGSQNIPAIDSVDTRSLVLALREGGTKIGAMVNASSEEEAKKMSESLITDFKNKSQDWAYEVSRKEKQKIQGAKGVGPRVAVIDFGCKENILRELISRTSEVTVFPSRVSAKEILDYKPDGVMLSNGPGDPQNVEMAVDTIKSLIGKTPIFGICMGHQLLGRALGAETFKLRFGHRGSNHPIKNMQTGEVFMTSQNHGYAIKDEGLGSNVLITHKNLNDQTVSGIECRDQMCFSVQFHPESHPGPRDAVTLFDQFLEWMEQ